MGAPDARVMGGHDSSGKVTFWEVAAQGMALIVDFWLRDGGQRWRLWGPPTPLSARHLTALQIGPCVPGTGLGLRREVSPDKV